VVAGMKAGERAVAVCREALHRGPLIRELKNHWRFGRRLFRQDTVNQLIEEGFAVQTGDRIERAAE
jgi:hypothetical protein